MANPEHVRRLVGSDRDSWNAWRKTFDGLFPDLSGANLYYEFRKVRSLVNLPVLDLTGFNFAGCDFTCADFSGVNTNSADFGGATMDCTWFDHGRFPSETMIPTARHSQCDQAPSCSLNEDWPSALNCESLCSELLQPDERHVDILLKGVDEWNRWRDEEPIARPNLSGLDLRDLYAYGHELRVDGLIQLCGANFEGAILRGAVLELANLRDANFRHADLRCALITHSNLRNANLSGTDFGNGSAVLNDFRQSSITNSRCVGVEFESVDLRSASLSETDLHGATFTDTYPKILNLRKASFDGAHLCGADFSEVDLTKVKLSEAMVWKADLFRGVSPSIHCTELAEQTPQLVDLEALLEVLQKIGLGDQALGSANAVLSDGHEPAIGLYFRGEDRDYELRPKLTRNPGWTESEEKLMLDLIARRPGEMGLEPSYFQRLAMARHFELPTRLLDVTRRASVALHYATANETDHVDGFLHFFLVPNSLVKPFDSDTVCLVANFTRLSPLEKAVLLTYPNAEWPDESRHATESGYDRSVVRRTRARFKHFISQEKPYWEDRIDIRDLFKVHFVEPQQSFDRLRLHDGAFMLSAFHDRLEASEVNRKVNQAASYQHFKLRVPHWAKGKIRRQLRLLGVTDESLRGDFQSAAEAVEAKYKVDEQARCDRCHEARQERSRPEPDSL